jgi:hypothetical protein
MGADLLHTVSDPLNFTQAGQVIVVKSGEPLDLDLVSNLEASICLPDSVSNFPGSLANGGRRHSGYTPIEVQ